MLSTMGPELGAGDIDSQQEVAAQDAMQNRTAHYQGRAGHARREGVRTMQSIVHPASGSLIIPIHMTGMGMGSRRQVSIVGRLICSSAVCVSLPDNPHPPTSAACHSAASDPHFRRRLRTLEAYGEEPPAIHVPVPVCSCTHAGISAQTLLLYLDVCVLFVSWPDASRLAGSASG